VGIGVALLQGCAQETPGTSTDGPSGKSGAGTTLYGGTVYHTGFDGNVNNFDIYIRTSRTITVHDPSIVSVSPVSEFELEQAGLTDALAQERVATLKQLYTDAGETKSARWESFWTRRFKNPSIWKLSPQKAGVTTISAESQRRTESIWEDAEIRTVVVSQYTPEQVEKGRQRYEGLSGGTACTACHNEAFGDQQGAPPHLLGRVIEINDTDAATWITTGAVKDRIASVQHAWQFPGGVSEQMATVAYLRSTQTTNAFDFAELLFQEEIDETKAELAEQASGQ